MCQEEKRARNDRGSTLTTTNIVKCAKRIHNKLPNEMLYVRFFFLLALLKEIVVFIPVQWSSWLNCVCENHSQETGSPESIPAERKTNPKRIETDTEMKGGGGL